MVAEEFDEFLNLQISKNDCDKEFNYHGIKFKVNENIEQESSFMFYNRYAFTTKNAWLNYVCS